MFSSLSFVLTLLLLNIHKTTAYYNVWNQFQNGVGASIQFNAGASINTGFLAKFYDLPVLEEGYYLFDNFVASGYSSNSIITSATAVTAPNFSYGPTLGGVDLYGLYNIDMNDILIEYTGYFERKYIFFKLFLFFFKNIVY